MRRTSSAAVALLLALVTAVRGDPPRSLPTPQQMADARADVWGEAALRQPDGPSYEFFRDLLPPLRYVNTDFRHYPLVLCAPAAAVKARWVSNGSAVNARANKKPMWREVGFPVRFHVGAKGEPFGDDVRRLDGPRCVEGWLPVVQVNCTEGGTRYEQEAFASVRGALAERGTVFLRFTARDEAGMVVAHVGAEGAVEVSDGSIRDREGRGLVLFDAGWTWDGKRKELRADLGRDGSAVLAVLTQPLPPPLPELTPDRYDEERKACVERWRELLGRGTRLRIPEPIVQDAWRALVVGNLLLAVGDRMNYSAGNAYDHLYEGECGDAVRSLLLFGRKEDARRMVGPLLNFDRQATRFHVAGHKLQLLSHYYRLTRDATYVREKEKVWKPVVELIVSNRQKDSGLLPKDNYAGDIKQQVVSLSSNANCWRGLRDLAAVLDDMGDRERAKELFVEAAAFRKAILDAVAKSERRDARPPFIPIALLADEPPHDPLTATRTGSYYDLMAPYVLGSEVLGVEREGWMIDYLRQHGGVAMGMIRSMPHQGEFDKQPGVNVLYGLRYQLALLRRDDREHALVGFYGHLAQAMTRGTFVGGEGSRFFHGDRDGRSFYLPPNSAANAAFLTVLRYLLVQDWDRDDDGRAETLHLLRGAPGRWLKDGAVLEVNGAPTEFGDVSFRVESRLQRGEVLLTVDPPQRRPERFTARLPLPTGWKVTAAKAGEVELKLGPGAEVELPGRERVAVRFRVEAIKP